MAKKFDFYHRGNNADVQTGIVKLGSGRKIIRITVCGNSQSILPQNFEKMIEWYNNTIPTKKREFKVVLKL